MKKLATKLGIKMQQTNTKIFLRETYDYQYENGNLKFQVLHYEPKDFKQRRPDGKGGWLWNLKGITVVPYKLPELMEAAKSGEEVIIAEGEKDVDALFKIGFRATCNPMGAGKWRQEFSAYFTGVPIVIVADKDEAGREHAKAVAATCKGESPSIKVIEMLGDNINDASDWIDSGETREQLLRIIGESPEWIDPETVRNEEERREEEEHQRLIEMAKPLLDNPAVLHQAIHTVEDLGVVGERRNIGLIRLQARSRALPRPVNIEFNSASSSGKTHTTSTTLQMEHEQAYYELSASSEKALIYTDEPLEHRILFIQEPEGLAQGVGSAIMKSLVWEGRLRYDTVERGEEGAVGRHIEKNGPTGLIVTTTRPLDEQLSNRMIRIEADDSREQTRRILISVADSVSRQRSVPDLTSWQAQSLLLGQPAEVRISYARFLADNISASSPRIRRDFRHLLTLISACTIEHRFQREMDNDGTLIATVADYAMVFSLVSETFRSIQAEGINAADRKMVSVLNELTTPPGGKPGEKPVTQAVIRDHLKLVKSSASYRVKRLLSMGYLTNLESRKGKEMKLVPGTPLPEEADPLPSPCDLTEYLVTEGYHELIIPWGDPVTGEVHNCREHVVVLHHAKQWIINLKPFSVINVARL
ncbi:hypothetical protein ACFLTV_01600 [Chloroflexota bacterium]